MNAEEELQRLRAERAALDKELRTERRRSEQHRRRAERAELLADRSKQAILSNNRELQESVLRLEALTDELREAKSRAERASEAKGRFVATISHELRTPMNGILGTAELLLSSKLDEDQEELARIVHRSARGLLSIINDVLDFTKAESNRIELESVRFDLHRLVEVVVDLERHAADKKEVGMEFRIAEGVPRWVVGDPVRLRQVLLNLVDNAIKFTLEGKVTVEVAGGASAADLAFRVSDSGIGIEPGVQKAIFDPFIQADSSTTRRFGGSGLGLAICRHLVQLMGGQIGVESELGRGSTFHFDARLPAAADQTATVSETSFRPTAQNFPRRKVLVVDDNSVNRLIATRMLQRLGCETVVAEDGKRALDLVSGQDFDVVFMDCSMPEMDGYEATARIRALVGPASRVRIVAMTAHAMSGDRERCLAAGMDDYVCKPVQLSSLSAALEAAGALEPDVAADHHAA